MICLWCEIRDLHIMCNLLLTRWAVMLHSKGRCSTSCFLTAHLFFPSEIGSESSYRVVIFPSQGIIVVVIIHIISNNNGLLSRWVTAGSAHSPVLTVRRVMAWSGTWGNTWSCTPEKNRTPVSSVARHLLAGPHYASIASFTAAERSTLRLQR